MANANVARGLLPVQHRNGAPWNGAYRLYYVPATYGTALFIGDPVIGVTASAETSGIPTVAIGVAGGTTNYLLGSVVGIGNAGSPHLTVTRDMPTYHPASTAGYVMVADDPDLLFEVQESASMGIGAAGRNAQLVAGAGSTISGYSGWQLDSTTLAVTATHQLRVIYPVVRADNDPATANAKWLVAINLHLMRAAAGV